MKKKAVGIFTVVALAALLLVPAVALGNAKPGDTELDLAKDQVKVTFVADKNGTVSADKVQAKKGTDIVIAGNTVTIGKSTVTATANPGFEFDKWTVIQKNKLSEVDEDAAEPEDESAGLDEDAIEFTETATGDEESVTELSESSTELSAKPQKYKVKENTVITASFKKSNNVNFVKQPQSISVDVGQKAEFSVEVQGGSGFYSYQWKQNDKILVGAILPTLTIFKADTENEGSYYCVVTDLVKKQTITSDVATLKLASTAHEINISNIGHGAGTASPSSAEAGTVVTLTATPSAGHVFKGWTVLGGGIKIVDNQFTMPNNDVYILATFARDSYTITYELNGGTINESGIYVAPRSYTFGEGVVLPTALVMDKEGCTFAGWYDNPECTGLARLIVSVNDYGDKTFYAKWNSKPEITIDKTVQEYTFDQKSHEFQLKLNPLAPKEGYTVEYRAASSEEWVKKAPTAAGTYDVRITRPEGLAWAEVNVMIEGGLVINQAVITVTPITKVAGITVAKKEYGSDDPDIYYTYKGTISPIEIPLFRGALDREEGEDVGTYAITLGTLKLHDSLTFKASNYRLELAEGYEFSIYQYQKTVKVTVVGHAGTLVYNTQEQAISGYEAFARDKVFNTATDLSYSGEAIAKGTDVGEYPMNLMEGTFSASKNFRSVVVDVTDGKLTITKAQQDAPKVTFVNESAAGAADGQILGTTTAMEYRLVDSEKMTLSEIAWVQATDEKVTNLAAGTYEIRYAGTENYLASDATVGTINVGLPLEVTFEMNGHGIAPETQYVEYQGYATRPAEDPTAEGYIFKGWFANVGGLYIEFPFEYVALEDDITIYAEWCAYSIEVVGPVVANIDQLQKIVTEYVKLNPLAEDVKLVLTVNQVASSDEEEIAAYAAIIGSDFVIYNSSLKLTADGIETDLTKLNEVLIPVTYKFDFTNKTNVKVWRMNLGVLEELTSEPSKVGEFSTIDQKAGEITVTASKFGVFAFSYTDGSAPTPSPVTPATGDTNNTLLLVVGIIAAVAVVGLIVAVVMKRSRRRR